MRKFELKNFFGDAYITFMRFHTVLFFTWALAIMSFFEINDKSFEVDFHVWAFFALSAIASLSISLFLENITYRLVRIAVYVLPIGFLAIYCFMFLDDKVNWEGMQYVAMMAVAVLSVFFVLFMRKNTDNAFWAFAEHLIREMLTTIIYLSLLMGGLSLAFYAVDILFDVQFSQQVYANIAVMCYLIIAPVYFLISMPSKDAIYSNKPDFGKFLRLLSLYVLLPVLGIYVLILYLYLAKILILWELPSGWVTILVSILVFGGFIAKLLLYPISKNKFVAFLNRYFPLLVLPLIVLMTVGIFRRFDDYGISINRLYVVIFNIWLYGASIYLFITRSKHLRWIVISFTVMLFLSSVGPWSVFANTRRVMGTDLKLILAEQRIFVSDSLLEKSANNALLNDTIAAQISDKTYYYIDNFGIDAWNKSFKSKKKLKSAYEVLEYIGISSSNLNRAKNYVTAQLPENRVLDIASYNIELANLQKRYGDDLVFKSDSFEVVLSGLKITLIDYRTNLKEEYSLMPLIQHLMSTNQKKDIKESEFIMRADNTMIVVDDFSANNATATKFEITNLKFSVYFK